MLKIRSLVFKAAFVLWTAWITVPFCFLLISPRPWLVRHLENWAKGVMRLLRAIVGVHYEIINAHHLPKKGPTFLISAHQSVWDTIIFHILVDDPCFIMKRILFSIPFYGWMAWKMGMVGIVRLAPSKTRPSKKERRSWVQMFEKAIARLKQDWTIIIFPEGTRVPPGEFREYKDGAYRLYKRISEMKELRGCRVVRVALNSGLFWPKRGALRLGRIKIKVLPPLPLRLGKDEFMEALEAIREEQRKL